MANDSVLQDWVVQLPLKMQSTLILGLRGPDTARLPEVKKLAKWLRGVVFKPGDPKNPGFMSAEIPQRIDEKSVMAQELEFCSAHYYTHLMHTFQLVGYGHPDKEKRDAAAGRYADMCRLWHLPTESREDLETRLGHKEWPEGKQPQDFEEAVAITGPVQPKHVEDGDSVEKILREYTEEQKEEVWQQWMAEKRAAEVEKYKKKPARESVPATVPRSYGHGRS